MKLGSGKIKETNQKETGKLLICYIVFLLTTLSSVCCIVIYQVNFTATKSGRSDYALAGESIELSYQHLMKDDYEEIKSVHWSKDGANFLRWSKYKPGLEVLDYTFKGHFDNASVHNHLILHNVTINMHGRYTCLVRTDLGTHQQELDVIVISLPHCKLSDWRITSEQLKCRETFRLDCRNMFPRPAPACGLWNDKKQKYIYSLPLDISEDIASSTNAVQTYRVRYVNRFDLAHPNGSINEANAHLFQYAGHLVFKCVISVPETSWKLRVEHKMFDFNDGCEQDPLEAIESMRASFGKYTMNRLTQQTSNKQQQLHPHGRFRHLDDLDKLASSLRFQILPPSQVNNLIRKQKYGSLDDLELNQNLASHVFLASTKPPPEYINEDLNCWKKPRVGTIIKLSCEQTAPSNPVKLMGSNLLECKANGWNLVKESHLINNEILNTKTYSVHMKKRDKDPTFYPLTQTKFPLEMSKNAPTTTPIYPAGNPPSGARGAGTSSKTEQKRTMKLVYTAQPIADHDDSDNVQDVTTFMSGSPPTEVNFATNSFKQTDNEDNDDSYLIFNGNNFVERILSASKSSKTRATNQDLEPEQLAALLPSCVSVSHRRRPQSAFTKQTGDKLPLLDTDSNSYYYHSNGKLQNADDSVRQVGEGPPEDWKWYSFMSSSADASTAKTMIIDGSLQSLIICSISAYSLLLATMSRYFSWS